MEQMKEIIMEHEIETDRIDELLQTLLSIEPKKIAKLLLREHRTHQQIITGNMYIIIDYLAEAYEQKAYDLRNEDALYIAKEIKKAKSILGYSEKTRLPYI